MRVAHEFYGRDEYARGIHVSHVGLIDRPGIH